MPVAIEPVVYIKQTRSKNLSHLRFELRLANLDVRRCARHNRLCVIVAEFARVQRVASSKYVRSPPTFAIHQVAFLSHSFAGIGFCRGDDDKFAFLSRHDEANNAVALKHASKQIAGSIDCLPYRFEYRGGYRSIESRLIFAEFCDELYVVVVAQFLTREECNASAQGLSRADCTQQVLISIGDYGLVNSFSDQVERTPATSFAFAQSLALTSRYALICGYGKPTSFHCNCVS